ncbi:hypothetical protein [Catellatospora tritici]|uniref:hypothetical protein n=1 Tax=Catellatospora tritici TaxID=2851566 RepID=UPI001C2D9B06|nr:hypothetical protein [Catellatospora tritici]MBV1855817.1 hypothetical protein [Catellatospora tritici]
MRHRATRWAALAAAVLTLVTSALVGLSASPASAGFPYLFRWSTAAGTVAATHLAGETGTDPYEGPMYGSVQSTQSGGSIYQDITRTIYPGDTYCASAQVATEGTATGGGVEMTVFLIWGNVESSTKTVADLPNRNNWTPVGTCVTATSAHTAVRIQFYPKVGGPAVAVDAVDLHVSLAANGGFNNGTSYWSAFAPTTFTTYGPGTAGAPYEGSRFAAATAGGSVYQDSGRILNPGDTYCATAQVASFGSTTGSGGTLAVWLLGGTTENATTSFAGLPGSGAWTPVTTCATATAGHSVVRVEIYPQPNVPTLLFDMVDLHPSLVRNGGFNATTAYWSTWAPTVLTTYGPGVTGNNPPEGARFGAALPGGSLYQDITGEINYCMSARMATLGTGGGASARLVLWQLPPSGNAYQLTYRATANLPGANTWTPSTVCGRGWENITRAEIYAESGTLAVDAVDLHRSLAANGGMNEFRID